MLNNSHWNISDNILNLEDKIVRTSEENRNNLLLEIQLNHLRSLEHVVGLQVRSIEAHQLELYKVHGNLDRTSYISKMHSLNLLLSTCNFTLHQPHNALALPLPVSSGQQVEMPFDMVTDVDNINTFLMENPKLKECTSIFELHVKLPCPCETNDNDIVEALEKEKIKILQVRDIWANSLATNRKTEIERLVISQLRHQQALIEKHISAVKAATSVQASSVPSSSSSNTQLIQQEPTPYESLLTHYLEKMRPQIDLQIKNTLQHADDPETDTLIIALQDFNLMLHDKKNSSQRKERFLKSNSPYGVNYAKQVVAALTFFTAACLCPALMLAYAGMPFVAAGFFAVSMAAPLLVPKASTVGECVNFFKAARKQNKLNHQLVDVLAQNSTFSR